MKLTPTNDDWVYLDENGNEVISTPPSVTEFDIMLMTGAFMFSFFAVPIGWFFSQWYLSL